MPDDLSELLTAAKRSPTDDAPRRAVAEYLSTHNDADRAEFVRLQLAQSVDGEWRPEQGEQQMAADRLLKKHALRWAGVPYAGPYWFKFTDAPASEDDDTPQASGRFARGLLRISGQPAPVRDALDRLPADQRDWVEMLDLHGVATAADLRALLTHPAGRGATAFELAAADDAPAALFDPLDTETVRELRLSGANAAAMRRVAAFKVARPHKLCIELPPDLDLARTLFTSPLLAEVQVADFSLVEQDPQLLTALAAAPHLRQLTRLDLGGDNFPPPSFAALFASDVVKGVRRLSVTGYSGHLKGVVAGLVKGGAARRLTHLDLGFNSVSTEEAIALAGSDLLAGLTSLDLGSGELTPEGAAALARSPNAANLERLDLSGTHIGEDAIFALAQSPHLKKLKELDLSRCGVTAKVLRALCQSPHLANLERLDLSHNPLPPFALDALSGSRTLSKLKSLGLRQLVIANDTFERLLRSPAVARLEHLDLQGTMLSKAKLRGLVEATSLDRLRMLVLGENILMKGEIDVLGEAAWLPRLADLTLYNTKMTDAGVRALTAKLTNGRLGRLDLSRNLLTDQSAEVLLTWSGLSGLTDVGLYQSGLGDAAVERVRRAAWST
ncbi:MAG: hypothetical protein MUF18_00520 [Fimbriiglobus sp.]|nr:hypothetical protein [Fimbriiglobus sp.]